VSPPAGAAGAHAAAGAPPLPDPVRALVAAAAPLDGVSLAELGTAALMERVDTKFLLPAALAPEAVRRCGAWYHALEVNGRRPCGYRTTYYDTADLALYHAHHAGRGTRRKVRVRTYLATGERYLEVKLRTNGGRTVKSRLRVPDGRADVLAHPDARPLLDPVLRPAGPSHAARSPGELREVVEVDYTRLTLVGRDGAERVTLDLLLAFATDDGAASFPGVAIAEVKQARHGRSCFLAAMRALGCRPVSISKYCLGVASLHDGAKKNHYKPLLHRIRTVADTHARTAHPG
jgi:hypothetical protein